MSHQLTKRGLHHDSLGQNQKFSLKDWSNNNQLKSRISCDQQKLADRVICEASRVIDETKEITNKFKKETDYRLEERIAHIAFTVEELREQKRFGEKEQEILKDMKNRIEHAIDSIRSDALVVCEKCIIMRENRTGIDNVDDDVEKSLRKERETILGTLSILDNLLTETIEQIRKVRAAIYLLDRDLANKESSLHIDQQNLVLRENQIDMKIYEGKMDLDPFNSTVLEWTRETTKNIELCKQEIKCAMSLRSYVEIFLKQAVEDISNHFNRTNEQFRLRMEEMRYAKIKLEGLHCGTANQVNDLTRNITTLEKELAEKERYVALSQMRLGNRAQRIGIELCKDKAHDTLIRELIALKDTYQKLSHMIDQVHSVILIRKL
ncbi:CLUMA_CG016208, isoform A [Clunio marinus]|uniref:Tektin n=1 Tax=Clunio marinus TaxID=568069 RepID=A0A1J1IY65_9DIPT|nr:CLUMA_CG016208, isoform A [Clunio marinus]